MTVVQFDNKTVNVPGTWNDLPLASVLYCYEIIMKDTGSWLDPVELLPFKKLLLVQHLLGMSKTYMEQWEQDCIQVHGDHDGQLIFIAELDEVLNTVDFLFEKQEDNEVAISLTYTKIPYPFLESSKQKKGKRPRLYGPKDELSNITIFELAYTFQLFENFIESQDPDQADQLIAALYRPQKPQTRENRRTDYYGDIRMPLYRLEHMVEKRKGLVKTLPEIVKKIIIFWFGSCRHQIIRQYENVFQPAREGVRRVGNDYGWGGMLLALSDGIANLDKISTRPYQDGLIYLSSLEDQRKQREMWGRK